MRVEMKVTWVMELNPEEFNLISRALRGTLKEEDKDKALHLQREMMEKRIKSFEAQAKGIEKLKKNLESNAEDPSE